MSTPVLVAVDELPPEAIDDTTEACRSLGLVVVRHAGGSSAAGGPRCGTVVAALPAGARRVPAHVVELAERHRARVVLLSPEPLRRAVATLRHGAITVIGLPIQRQSLVTALRGVAPYPIAATGDGRGFESLQRSSWTAWHRDATAPHRFDVHHGPDGALTAVVFLAADVEASALGLAALLDDALTDSRREAQLWEDIGVDAGVVRLGAGADEWLVYWPRHEQALTLWSPHRVPARWSIDAAMASARRRMLRLPAYPDDLLMAVVDPDGNADLSRALAGPHLAGGPDARAVLVAELPPRVGCLLVEVR